MSAVDSNAARLISNYRQVATVGLASANSSEKIVTFHIRFDTSFYFAIRDVSWCLVISRVLIFYTVCQYKASHLSIRPETIAPIDNTQVNAFKTQALMMVVVGSQLLLALQKDYSAS